MEDKKIDRFLMITAFLAGITLIVFGELAEDVWFQEIMSFDHDVITWAVGFSSPLVTKIMIMITSFGSPIVLITSALAAISLLYRREKSHLRPALVLLALSGGWVANSFLKWVFHRPRPQAARLVEVGGFSFPSGHAMVSISLYGFLAYLLWHYLSDQRTRIMAVLSLGLLVIMIGLSRIYLGVHYPSDVLAGLSAGGFWLLGCIFCLRVMEKRWTK